MCCSDSSAEIRAPCDGELAPEVGGVWSQRGVIKPLPPAPNTKPPLRPSVMFEYPEKDVNHWDPI